MKLARFSIAVDQSTKEKLDLLAEKEKRSIASMARILIEEAIQARETTENK